MTQPGQDKPDYGSTPPDDAKPPGAGQDAGGAPAGKSGQESATEEGLREQDEAARERAEEKGYQ